MQRIKIQIMFGRSEVVFSADSLNSSSHPTLPAIKELFPPWSIIYGKNGFSSVCRSLQSFWLQTGFLPCQLTSAPEITAVQNPKPDFSPGNELFELQAEAGFRNVSNESCTLNSKRLHGRKRWNLLTTFFLPVQLTELTTWDEYFRSTQHWTFLKHSLSLRHLSVRTAGLSHVVGCR